jgi:transcriptional regulator with XRE-family HTH domain
MGKLAERLRAAIEARGMKHAWVAMEAGITPATLSNILTGRTSDPSFSVVLAIARAVGQPLAAILDEPPQTLLESEQEVLRQAIGILERRILRSPSRGFALAAFGGQSVSEADALPRHAIPAAIHRRGARLVFRATGDVLSHEGIRDGDILYVKPASDIRDADGRLVVCRVDGATLTRKLVATGRGIRLQAGNSSLSVPDEAEFELVGIVIAHLSER